MEIKIRIVNPLDLSKRYKEDNKLRFDTDMDTDKINSDDFEFFNRRRNFEIISKKLNRYYDTKFQLYKGNDLRYNNYIRKLTKLSKHESLDYEGYKDFLENCKKLNESKSQAMKGIAKHFLDELLTKESLQSEIRDFVKICENSNERKINTSTLGKDIKDILENTDKNFKSVMKDVFKLKDEEKLSAPEFDDIKVLRITKLVIKLRQYLIAKRSEKAADQTEKEETDTVFS